MRGEISTAHIEEAYSVAGDGSMSACLGKDCPAPCCRERMVVARAGKVVTGIVRLYNEAEAAYQHGILNPPLPDLGAYAKVYLDRNKATDRTEPHFFLGGCQKEDGSCNLEGRKPIFCRLFPFNLEANDPVSLECCRVLEICEDEELVNVVLRVREALGFRDNDAWNENRLRKLAKIRARK